MKMNKHIDHPYIEAVYYISTLYPLTLRMVEFAVQSPTHPALEKLAEYYLRFKTYLKVITRTTETFARYAEAIEKLPLTLDTEEILEWEAKGIFVDKTFLPELARLFEENNANIFVSPNSFKEAVKNVEQCLQVSTTPDLSVLQKENQEMVKLLEITNNKLQGKIVIEQDGTAQFHSPAGKVYRGTIKKGTNEYNMLEYLNESVGTVQEAKDIVLKLNDPKAGAYKDTKLRVRDTAVAIKNSLHLPDTSTIFIVNRGYGLKYPVEFISHSS